MLLRARLQGDPARTKPFTVDVRRAGSWWWIDFHFKGEEVTAKGYERKTFAMEVQARALQKALVMIMG